MIVFTNDKELLFCDGEICQIFKKGRWIFHSKLNASRIFGASMVTLANGIYVFGSNPRYGNYHLSSEFLPNGSKIWEKGPNIPEPGFECGSAVAISDIEVVLTGGLDHGYGKGDGRTMMKYNTNTNEWTILKDLKVARRDHSAIFYNGKIILTGGYWHNGMVDTENVLDSTEIYHLDKECSEMGGNLNIRRQKFGLSVIKKNNSSKLIAFGGLSVPQSPNAYVRNIFLSSIEEWNDEEKKWEVSQLKLKEPKYEFGFC